jgi:hypothetical protein
MPVLQFPREHKLLNLLATVGPHHMRRNVFVALEPDLRLLASQGLISLNERNVAMTAAGTAKQQEMVAAAAGAQAQALARHRLNREST